MFPSVFTTTTSISSPPPLPSLHHLHSCLSFRYTATTHNQYKPVKVEMKLFSLIFVSAATILSVQACKCVDPNGGADNDVETAFCCAEEGGTFQDGNDCAANSISNELSEFESCCNGSGLNSDCSCPTC